MGDKNSLTAADSERVERAFGERLVSIANDAAASSRQKVRLEGGQGLI
jgi:hypothetical protein